jgi:VIT1/CCC1 family predicted Fe2+/Mn2+ transporter
MKMLDKEIEKKIFEAQRNEITEYSIYKKLAQSIKEPKTKEILNHISDDEFRHYNFWRKYTDKDIKPSSLRVLKYFLISKIFGITFGIKLMESGEEKAQVAYKKISKSIPEAESIIEDEDGHENQLIDLIDEERLRYVGSMVLGLNDALVELTGVLAGFTLALQETRLVAVAGLITGVAGSFSMAASEYLSTKSELSSKNPFKAAIYTCLTYLFTVSFLILPYLLIGDIYSCLGLSILNAIIVIFLFTFYISIAKDLSFKKRFLEMTMISLGIAFLTFTIGFFIRMFLKIEV